MHFTTLVSIAIFQVVIFFPGNNVRVARAGSIGSVSCRVAMHWSEEFMEAHEKCAEKISKEHENDKDKDTYKPYPRNASLEEFEFDDKCYMHCVFKLVGISTDDAPIPDKKTAVQFITRGKVSDDGYSKMTAILETCIDKVDKISKNKKMDKCKTAGLLEFCFFTEIRKSEKDMEIDC